METQKITLYLYSTIASATILASFVYQFQLMMFSEKMTLVAVLPLILVGVLFGLLLAKNRIDRKELKELKAQSKKQTSETTSYMNHVVHDLRSPLASINMICELLQEEIKDLEPGQRELLKSVTVSSTSLLDRVGGILDNSRIQNKIENTNLIDDNPYAVIKCAIEKHHMLAADKNIQIINRLSPNLPNCYFDTESLESVVSNLVGNAIKYSNKATCITISSYYSKGKCVIQIKDEGLGMTKDDLKKVFGQFTRLSAIPTAGEPSTGLGLSLVKKMVENMGGEVSASSEGKGFGSTFSFELQTTAKVARLSA